MSFKYAIVIIVLNILAYTPLYWAVYWTNPSKVYYIYNSSYDDYPICSGNCFDVWESEGNFGKPW